MQPLLGAPREAMTADTVTGLLRDANAVTVTNGCELIDRNLELVEDISAEFAGGSVSRNSYATLHGTASLQMIRELDWGSAIVRPYLVLSDGVTSARFNLGAYFTSVPKRDVDQQPPTYEVAGVDILHGLAGKAGESYAVEAGVAYLDAVEQVLRDQGYTRFVLDPAATGTVLPSARVWPLDDRTTWLGIVNDLLAAIGYGGVWSDWDGQLRCEPYQPPADRPPEWLYDADVATSMLGPARRVERDFFDAPNRWVFVRNNNVDDVTPVEGNGVYTYVNEAAGDTSVAARERVISKVEFVDAADQASLETRAWVTIDADMRIPQKVALTTFPNPLHWHFDRLALDDPGVVDRWADILGTQWTLPLDGGDQSHEWSVL